MTGEKERRKIPEAYGYSRPQEESNSGLAIGALEAFDMTLVALRLSKQDK
jgi:hypothetical protein